MNTQEMRKQVEERLKSTNWARYAASVSWANNKPNCSHYDGNRVCDYWRGWIVSGRAFYPQTKEGQQQYTDEVQQEVPQLTRKDIASVLTEAKKNPITRLFWNADRERYGSVEKVGEK